MGERCGRGVGEEETLSFLMLRAMPNAAPRRVVKRPNDWKAMWIHSRSNNLRKR